MMPWWWLSFASVDGWLGAAVVQGSDEIGAIRMAWRLGINPGGEVMAIRSPAWHGDPPERFRGRLLSRIEAAELSMEWTNTPLHSTADEEVS